jgi:hypothetical protein
LPTGKRVTSLQDTFFSLTVQRVNAHGCSVFYDDDDDDDEEEEEEEEEEGRNSVAKTLVALADTFFLLIHLFEVVFHVHHA